MHTSACVYTCCTVYAARRDWFTLRTRWFSRTARVHHTCLRYHSAVHVWFAHAHRCSARSGLRTRFVSCGLVLRYTLLTHCRFTHASGHAPFRICPPATRLRFTRLFVRCCTTGWVVCTPRTFLHCCPTFSAGAWVQRLRLPFATRFPRHAFLPHIRDAHVPTRTYIPRTCCLAHLVYRRSGLDLVTAPACTHALHCLLRACVYAPHACTTTTHYRTRCTTPHYTLYHLSPVLHLAGHWCRACPHLAPSHIRTCTARLVLRHGLHTTLYLTFCHLDHTTVRCGTPVWTSLVYTSAHTGLHTHTFAAYRFGPHRTTHYVHLLLLHTFWVTGFGFVFAHYHRTRLHLRTRVWIPHAACSTPFAFRFTAHTCWTFTLDGPYTFTTFLPHYRTFYRCHVTRARKRLRQFHGSFTFTPWVPHRRYLSFSSCVYHAPLRGWLHTAAWTTVYASARSRTHHAFGSTPHCVACGHAHHFFSGTGCRSGSTGSFHAVLQHSVSCALRFSRGTFTLRTSLSPDTLRRLLQRTAHLLFAVFAPVLPLYVRTGLRTQVRVHVSRVCSTGCIPRATHHFLVFIWVLLRSTTHTSLGSFLCRATHLYTPVLPHSFRSTLFSPHTFGPRAAPRAHAHLTPRTPFHLSTVRHTACGLHARSLRLPRIYTGHTLLPVATPVAHSPERSTLPARTRGHVFASTCVCPRLPAHLWFACVTHLVPFLDTIRSRVVPHIPRYTHSASHRTPRLPCGLVYTLLYVYMVLPVLYTPFAAWFSCTDFTLFWLDAHTHTRFIALILPFYAHLFLRSLGSYAFYAFTSGFTGLVAATTVLPFLLLHAHTFTAVRPGTAFLPFAYTYGYRTALRHRCNTAYAFGPHRYLHTRTHLLPRWVTVVTPRIPPTSAYTRLPLPWLPLRTRLHTLHFISSLGPHSRFYIRSPGLLPHATTHACAAFCVLSPSARLRALKFWLHVCWFSTRATPRPTLSRFTGSLLQTVCRFTVPHTFTPHAPVHYSNTHTPLRFHAHRVALAPRASAYLPHGFALVWFVLSPGLDATIAFTVRFICRAHAPPRTRSAFTRVAHWDRTAAASAPFALVSRQFRVSTCYHAAFSPHHGFARYTTLFPFAMQLRTAALFCGFLDTAFLTRRFHLPPLPHHQVWVSFRIA